MSFEQSIDQNEIERTKQQIRALVGEIAQLAKTEVTPEEFYGQFLPRVLSALAASGGAVWTLNPEGQLALQYQVNIQETQLRDNQEAQQQHGRLLYKALSSPEGMLVPPHSGPGELAAANEDAPATNPTGFLLILGLLKTDLETIGVVEIFQRGEANAATQKGYLRFLMQMCELAGDFLKSHQLRHFSDRQALWTQLEDFTRGIHASLDPRTAAYTIANEGRRLIECDRVSVAIRHGKKCKIEAVSGQDVFDKRSNAVRLLGKLATAVVAAGDPVWYTGDTRDLPPQVEDALQEYVDEAHSKTVAVLPLARPAPPEEDDPKKREEPEGPIGALIVEQIEDSRVSPSLAQRSEVVCRHSSTALANALEHQNLFLMPVWRAIGKSRWVVQGRTLPKTLSIAGAVIAVVLVLIFWPASFTLEAKGTLEPVLRQDVFVGVDGVVQDIYVAHGDAVKKEQLLVKLRNTDLEVAITDVQGQRLATIEQLSAVQRSLVQDRTLRIEERNRLAGQAAELKQKLKTLDAQLVLQKAKQAELQIKSPLDGEVITWDLRNRLIHRPVQRGQALLRVADPDGPWQLEVHMPENHMGHVTSHQQVQYDEFREKLRALLREDARVKLGEAATEEDVNKAVDAELDQAPDEGLRDRLAVIYLQRIHAGIEPILKDVADEKLREKLVEVAGTKTYDDARTKLDAVLHEIEAQPAPKVAETPVPQETPKADETKPAGDSKEIPKAEEAPAASEPSKPAETPNAGSSQEPAKVAETPAPPAPPAVDADLLAKLRALPHEELPNNRLTVTYILATEPGTTYNGVVQEIHRSAEVRGDEGNTVLIKVELNKSEMEQLRQQQKLRPGATVTAKVDCGRRALGYVLLHDLISFVQSRIMFRFF